MATLRSKSKNKEAFGDFQTPLGLASDCLATIASKWHIVPSVVVEPTCGRGAFVAAAAKIFSGADQIIAAEINPGHLQAAKLLLSASSSSPSLSFVLGSFFDIDWTTILPVGCGDLLVVGNPPWVTTSSLGVIEIDNLPKKRNDLFKGIEALTGKSNFDISEWMIYQYAEWLAGKNGGIAILCKTAVARKAIVKLGNSATSRPFAAQMYGIDAMKHFGVAVDACLLGMQFSPAIKETSCEVFQSLSSASPFKMLVVDGDHLVGISQRAANKRFRATENHYIWRSGIKHDCSRVMELSSATGVLINGLKEPVNIEPEYVYPLLKSSCIGNSRTDSSRFMVVPQRKTGEVTSVLERVAPRTWAYLNRHRTALEVRGSSIYKGKPPFTIFGVGEYSFAPWKVAVSALYKRLNFVVVGPINGKPVVFDDTVNFLPAASEQEARFLQSVLSSDEAQTFFSSMIHWTDKRPITISVLARLDIRALSKHLGREGEYMQYSGSARTKDQGELSFA